MNQITVNGIAVSAYYYSRKDVTVDNVEVERLLRAYPNLPFAICTHPKTDIKSLDQLERFKGRKKLFTIRPLNTEAIPTTSDVEFAFDEACIACIDAIKMHIKRIGGFIDLDVPMERYRQCIEIVPELSAEENYELQRAIALIESAAHNSFDGELYDKLYTSFEKLEEIKALQILVANRAQPTNSTVTLEDKLAVLRARLEEIDQL